MLDSELGIDVPEGGFPVPEAQPKPTLRDKAIGKVLDVATAAVEAATRQIKKLP